MLHRKLKGFLLVVLVMGLTTVAWAGVPDLDLSTAVTAAPPGVSVFNLLNGQGDPMTIARDSDGGPTFDATITLTLLDGTGAPIAFYPSEDMLLVTSGGSLVRCPNGTAANLSTDVNGVTRWATPLFAGGHTENETVIVLIGGAALNQPGLPIIFNSADISGDLQVSLTDLTPFSTDYRVGPYNYRSDFVRDGVISISDLTQFARGYFVGNACQ